MPRLGERQAYWIWLKRGGRLSEVASPPTSTNSFKVQVPVWGNIASLVYLVVVYIRQSASIAPGHRAAACEVCVVGRRLLSIHFSGATVSDLGCLGGGNVFVQNLTVSQCIDRICCLKWCDVRAPEGPPRGNVRSAGLAKFERPCN